MLFNAAQSAMLLSAVHIALGASTIEPKNVDAVRRHWGHGIDLDDGYVGHDYGATRLGGVGGGVRASSGLSTMVAGWGQLTLAFNQLRATCASGASIDVAIRAVVSLRAQVQSITGQHSSCGCSASAESTAAFTEMVVQFFTSFQLALQAGRTHYGSVWDARCRPIFAQYSSAFVSLKAIAASIQVDLAVVLQRAQVNTQLFAAVGLDISALLQIVISHSVSSGLSTMVEGWGQLTLPFNQLRATCASGASIDVAIRAVVSLRTQVQHIASQHSSCGCSASTESTAAFKGMVVQFFTSFQLALEAGQTRYGSLWETRCRPIFAQYSSAFVSLKAIAASIQVDLAVVLQRAQVNIKLFAAFGLNISALLQLSHSAQLRLGPSIEISRSIGGIVNH